MTALEVVDDVMVGTVPGRWIRTSTHLDPDCGCGEVEVLLVSMADGALWIPAGIALAGRDALLAAHECDEEWPLVVERMAAAFGLPWERMTVSRVRGQMVLLAVLEEGTLGVLASLDPERLFEMRRVNREPAEVLRALRLMRDYGAARQ